MNNDLSPLPSWDSEGTWRTFEDGTFHQTILGVEVQKSPDDLDRYDELIKISQPDVVIETGTRTGGSALWFSERVPQVLSIDINRNAGKEAKRKLPGFPQQKVHWWSGTSIDPDMIYAAQEMFRGLRVMVSLDSDHHSMHVQTEIALWAPLVSPGCYLVVEDGCFDMWPGARGGLGGKQIPRSGGPLDAMRKMGLGSPLECPEPLKRFWRDEALEGMSRISHSPAGWWRTEE